MTAARRPVVAPVVAIAAPPAAPPSAIDAALDALRARASAATDDARDRAARVVAAAGAYRAAVEQSIASRLLLAAGLPAPCADIEGAALELLGAVEQIPECALALAELRASAPASAPAQAAPLDLEAGDAASPDALDAPAAPPASELAPATPGPSAPATMTRAPVPHSELATLTALRAATALRPLVIVSTSAPGREVLERLREGLPGLEWLHISKDHGMRRVLALIDRVRAGRIGALLVCRVGMPHKAADPLKGAALAARTVAFATCGSSSWSALSSALRELNADARKAVAP